VKRWTDLPSPILALAPMADVTDAAFRTVIAKCGTPDVMWTEFVSADGLYHTRERQRLPDSDNPLMKDLIYGENERPIVAQIFSGQPEMIEYAAALMVELGFDGVDLNMGCPVSKIDKQEAGASLIKDPKRAQQLVRAAQKGAQGRVPVTVKTRIGYNKNELDTWLPALLEAEPDAITVHARTKKEMSLVPARWEHVREAVQLRNALRSKARILGNGDLVDTEDARNKVRESGADGAMLGRAIFGNPWLFTAHSPTSLGKTGQYMPTTQEKLLMLIEHCTEFERLCGHKNFSVMRKHFKAYVEGFPNAKELRIELMQCSTADEVGARITKYLDSVA
jgi:nifR3 family TIM-barrel protein